MRGRLGVRVFLTVLLCISCSSSIRPVAGEATYRSMKAIVAATSVGVNKLTYDDLLRVATTELLIFSDISSDSVSRLTITRYASALDQYHDASKLWDEQINNAQYSFLPAGRIFQADSTLALRYGLEITAHRWSGSRGVYFTVPRTSIQLIWSAAETTLRAADSLVLPQLRQSVQ